MSPTWQRIVDFTESLLEQAIFRSRWILAPFYAGLALSLVVLLIKFIAELLHIMVTAFTATEADIIVGVLSLVDLALTGSLLIIVIFSGYENFVSRLDHTGHRDWPQWMGTIDFSALKLKLLSSIVAISAIQLLKQFMEIKKILASPTGEREMFWYVTVHVVFVVSSVLLALSDRIAGDHGNHAHSAPPENAPAPHERRHGHDDPAISQSHGHAPAASATGGPGTAAISAAAHAERHGS